MFFDRLWLFAGIMLFPMMSFAQDREQIMDDMIQLLQEGGMFSDKVDALGAMAHRFNEGSAIVRQEVTPVVALNPVSMRSMIADSGKTRIALAVCGNVQGLHSCTEAVSFLQKMTAQCSEMYLGTVDYDTYPGVPFILLRDEKFDPSRTNAVDPNLQLFERSELDGTFSRISATSRVRPDIVATIMCPEESDTFGRVLRMLPKQ